MTNAQRGLTIGWSCRTGRRSGSVPAAMQCAPVGQGEQAALAIRLRAAVAQVPATA